MIQWTEKYRPQKISEIRGQEESIKKILIFLKNFPNKKKSIVINGPPGVGKTSIVHALKKETKSEIFEINSSDLRNKEKLMETLNPATKQQSLFHKNKIILVDEVDGISAVDKGGLTTLISLIKETDHPIICTSNDLWSKKLSDLRKVSEIVELKPISPSTQKNFLNEILEKEKIFFPEKTLNQIVINSKGDMRAAINDLQTASSMEKPEEFVIEQRKLKTDIFNSLREIFQDKASIEMLGTFDKIDMPIDEIILWVEENIPKVYSGVELKNAYEKLARVDLFKGRIYKQQYWRFLVYENFFLSYGISQAKGDVEKKGFYKYGKPERILKIWLNNQRNAKKKTIAEKYAKETHKSIKLTMKDWRIISKIIKSNPSIQKQLKLDSDEIIYLNKY